VETVLVVPPQDVLQGCSHVEVLLLQPQLFPSLHLIVRVEDRCHILCCLPFLHRVYVGDFIRIHGSFILIIGSGPPEPQVVGVESIIA